MAPACVAMAGEQNRLGLPTCPPRSSRNPAIFDGSCVRGNGGGAKSRPPNEKAKPRSPPPSMRKPNPRRADYFHLGFILVFLIFLGSCFCISCRALQMRAHPTAWPSFLFCEWGLMGVGLWPRPRPRKSVANESPPDAMAVIFVLRMGPDGRRAAAAREFLSPMDFGMYLVDITERIYPPIFQARVHCSATSWAPRRRAVCNQDFPSS